MIISENIISVSSFLGGTVIVKLLPPVEHSLLNAECAIVANSSFEMLSNSFLNSSCVIVLIIKALLTTRNIKHAGLHAVTKYLFSHHRFRGLTSSCFVFQHDFILPNVGLKDMVLYFQGQL